MKKLALVVLLGSLLAGFAYHLNRPKTQPVVAAGAATEASNESVESSQPATPATHPFARVRPHPDSATGAASEVAAGVSPARSHFDVLNEVTRAADILVSPQASYAQKQSTWKELRESGRLDPVITELEQRVANDPRTAAYPAALGQAYLQKCGTIQDVREQGILAMQADKAFDSALNLDPENWEARFTKTVALTYWPESMNKGTEVITSFQKLILQQEAQAPQPQFADTYSWLGEQYKKAGRTDYARTVWERGAALFPDNDGLKTKLAGVQ